MNGGADAMVHGCLQRQAAHPVSPDLAIRLVVSDGLVDRRQEGTVRLELVHSARHNSLYDHPAIGGTLTRQEIAVTALMLFNIAVFVLAMYGLIREMLGH